ncbi:MAG: alpha/beta fold hydrolase [Holosporaceae bacterium]|jgi:polyhydroxyalkanoate synthase|nr:alpha/beta fold hydrolase [Holosporaceae bacterium]
MLQNIFSLFNSRNIDAISMNILSTQVLMLQFLKVGCKLAEQPQKLEMSINDLLNRLLLLQKNFMNELDIGNNHGVITLKYNKKERIYEDNVFANNPAIKFVNMFYKTVSSWMMETIENIDGVDSQLQRNAQFIIKQYIDMLSPNNFPFFNPDFLKESIHTSGENIKKGIKFLMNDIFNGSITTHDRRKFQIGKNIATTRGKVIFQNELIELIQYSPTTDKVYTKPILLVPPWINKFYVLDLTTKMSFVKWLVDNGFTVFLISWVNPNEKYRNIGFEDYVLNGLLTSLDKIHEITGETQIHAFGYCVGGTLISVFMAYMAHKSCKHQSKMCITSATLMATLVDFRNAGDLSVFMTKIFLETIQDQIEDRGILDGQIMHNTFSALKAKDMVWRYFVNSYMLGKEPSANAILFWNSDSTNLTMSMQKFLSRDLYSDTMLVTGNIRICGVPINLERIQMPLYIVSFIGDHLVPWVSTFGSAKLFGGDVRFVLGGSGHVAGAINHSSNRKYCYWTNEKANNRAGNSEEWIKTATQTPGSWWNDWICWVVPKMGEKTKSRNISTWMRDAPGIYIHNELLI